MNFSRNYLLMRSNQSKLVEHKWLQKVSMIKKRLCLTKRQNSMRKLTKKTRRRRKICPVSCLNKRETSIIKTKIRSKNMKPKLNNSPSRVINSKKRTSNKNQSLMIWNINMKMKQPISKKQSVNFRKRTLNLLLTMMILTKSMISCRKIITVTSSSKSLTQKMRKLIKVISSPT